MNDNNAPLPGGNLSFDPPAIQRDNIDTTPDEFIDEPDDEIENEEIDQDDVLAPDHVFATPVTDEFDNEIVEVEQVKRNQEFDAATAGIEVDGIVLKEIEDAAGRVILPEPTIIAPVRVAVPGVELLTFLIYMYVFPSGRGYVGVTTGTEAHRTAQHMYEAKNYPPGYGSFLLNAAIRKYGKFTRYILYRGSATREEMDGIEAGFIAKYNTLKPNGYNLKVGGHTLKQTEEMLAKRSLSLRKDKRWLHLPRHTKVEVSNDKLKFRVNGHPKAESGSFVTEEAMMQHLNEWLTGKHGAYSGPKKRNVQKSGLPKYITRAKYGYYVKYKGKTVGKFTNRTMSLEDLYTQAVECAKKYYEIRKKDYKPKAIAPHKMKQPETSQEICDVDSLDITVPEVVGELVDGSVPDHHFAKKAPNAILPREAVSVALAKSEIGTFVSMIVELVTICTVLVRMDVESIVVVIKPLWKPRKWVVTRVLTEFLHSELYDKSLTDHRRDVKHTVLVEYEELYETFTCDRKGYEWYKPVRLRVGLADFIVYKIVLSDNPHEPPKITRHYRYADRPMGQDLDYRPSLRPSHMYLEQPPVVEPPKPIPKPVKLVKKPVKQLPRIVTKDEPKTK